MHIIRHFNIGLTNCISKVRVYNSEIDAYEYKCEELSPGRKRIFVLFKIDKDGSVTSINARAPHPRLEEEAIRVIKLLPQMKPGKDRGKPVRVGYTLPITFNVD